MSEPGWYWRNCRSVGLKIDLWLWPWAFGAYREDDVYGGQRGFHLGPLGVGVAYSIGSKSSYGLDRFTALCEVEAYERAEQFHHRAAVKIADRFARRAALSGTPERDDG